MIVDEDESRNGANELCDRGLSRRALRRHHKNRMKAKAKFIAKRVWGFVSFGMWSDEDLDRAAKSADHLAKCSCEMCRNPRRSRWRRAKGKTRKELQVEGDLRESAG